ncbi:MULTISPECIES: hypothetical protein [Eubacterium]|uniref:hypothetical protein n=1 Tax=Eubacterium TaxID=1730 RepID=UPI0011C223BD|nr:MULTISPECIES: hypothetical protein [Eubacterium]
MKPLKLWKRMALRGKILTVILLLLLISAIVGIGAAVYHIPLLVQNRAVQSVNALFTENDAELTEGVAQNTGQISDSIKKANQVRDEAMRSFLLQRTSMAQKMADAINGVSALYQTKEDGSRVVVRTIQPFQVDNINKNLSELDAMGKTEFTAAVRQDFADAQNQYNIYKQINDLLDGQFTDGSARNELSEDASSEACDEAQELVAQLENPDTQTDMNFAISQVRKKVEEQEAAQEAARIAEEEAREAERKAEEEAKKAEEEAKKKNNPAEQIKDAINSVINPNKTE